MQPGTQACKVNLFRPNAFEAHESIVGSIGKAGSDLSSIADSNIPPPRRAARSSRFRPRNSVDGFFDTIKTVTRVDDLKTYQCLIDVEYRRTRSVGMRE